MATHDTKYPNLRETRFVDLMQKRIFDVLILANPYDAFMLEDDGRVDEKIFYEYAKLGLATLCIGGGMGVATIWEKC